VPLEAGDTVNPTQQTKTLPVDKTEAKSQAEMVSFESPTGTGSTAVQSGPQVIRERTSTSDSKPPSEPVQPVTSTDDDASTNDETLMRHAEDYGWLQGTLEYVHSNSGRWKLRYAPLWAEDRFGGSVSLEPGAWLDKFREGDVIYMEGELVQPRSSDHGSSPVYRVHSIRPVRVAP
jgi:hypothetical protein